MLPHSRKCIPHLSHVRITTQYALVSMHSCVLYEHVNTEHKTLLNHNRRHFQTFSRRALDFITMRVRHKLAGLSIYQNRCIFLPRPIMRFVGLIILLCCAGNRFVQVYFDIFLSTAEFVHYSLKNTQQYAVHLQIRTRYYTH